MFARTSPVEQHFGPTRFPLATTKDPRWLPLVKEAFFDRLLRGAAHANPIRQLVLLKRAINDVTYRLTAVRAEEQRTAKTAAVPNDVDPLSATMAFLRAAE